MGTLALLGATGSLGRAIGHELSAAGRPYRAASRSHLALQVRFADPLAQPVLWDPEQPASIAKALAGVQTAIYLVGVPLWEFAKHLPLTGAVLQACRDTGVGHLLLVSSSWAYGPPQAERVTEDHPLAAPTAKGRIRREQEQMVLEASGKGGLETSVLRVGDFYGPYVEASYLWSAFQAAKRRAHAQLMSPADAPHEFVYVPDAARTILRMLDRGDLRGRAWNLGGAGLTTLVAMTEAIFKEAGTPPNYEITPAWKLRIVAMMNPYVRAMREMQYLLETPVLLEDSALRLALGGLEKTAYTQGIRETLATVRIGR